MTFQNVLDTFFLREDQDAFARSQGWEDAEQMCHYEDMNGEDAMTDREMEAFVEREEAIAAEADGTVQFLAPPPSEILVLQPPHELEKVDPRELYWEPLDFSCVDTGSMVGVF